MKSIFYRVWDTQENKYFEPTYEAFNGKLEDLHLGLGGDLFMRTMDGTIHCDSVFPGRFVVEHTTNYLDRNQKVMFEGDIINYQYGEGTIFSGIVERHNKVLKIGYESTETLFVGFIIRSCPDTKDEFFTEIPHNAGIEIIGNIHQKPEGI